MAIVKMRKLNLVAMSYDKDAILDALQRTNAAEVTLHAPTEETVALAQTGEEIKSYLVSVETALSTLCGAVEKRQKEENDKSDILKDGFDVSYSEFFAAKEQKPQMDELVQKINALTDEKNRLKGELSRVTKQRESAQLYAELTLAFDEFIGTSHTRGRLGVVPTTNKDGLLSALESQELCACEVISVSAEGALVCVFAHKSQVAETDSILSAYAFSDCPYKGEKTGKAIYEEYCAQETQIKVALEENERTVYALRTQIRPLKVYCDYMNFALEKETVSDKLRATERTFLLEAYVPEPAEEEVKAALNGVSGAVYMDFSDPLDTDEPPTLLKNNAVVSCFEGITNTYSAPHYREFDPNAIMAIFYSIFMGFIIGDAGYGLLMMLGGGYLWWKGRARPTGTSRMAGSFAIGGIFAVIWGALFNSFFGFMPLPKTIMPNPQTGMWSLVGIKVPGVLIIAMLIGIVQLFAGYLCKTAQEWRRGNIMDGICDGVLWAFFCVGVALAIVGLTKESNIFPEMPILTKIGGITAGASLVLAMLTAGRKEKFFGKFTKGFGAAYGIINFASDVLSYARLYGLMLSGAVIAGIIADYSGQFLMSGNIAFIILAVVLLIIGNAFNLVMNLLGAYIHDARLQYVEFFGRFYEGEGELFSPLGSGQKYIYLTPNKQAETQKN